MRRHRTAGLSVPQYRTLCLLHRYPGIALSLVAENLGSTLPTASRIISGLVRRGYVTRDAGSADRRKLSLILTPQGKAVRNTAHRSTEEAVARVLEEIPAAERSVVIESMYRLLALFDIPTEVLLDTGHREQGHDVDKPTKQARKGPAKSPARDTNSIRRNGTKNRRGTKGNS